MQHSIVTILKKKWQQMPKILKNKYALVFVLFLVWLIFLDPNNFIKRIKSYNQLDKLKNEKQYYEKQIEESRQALEDIKNDKENIEKYAREKYYMKKSNEDLFVVKEADNKK